MVELNENSSGNLADVRMQWGVMIPLRDGVRLNATLYVPKAHRGPSPVIFTLTPYVGQNYHDQAMYFAANGYPFLTVDVRGRGNSEGIFKPNVNEAYDGHDVVEWLAGQPYCNGQVAMWGGSYGGLDQWNTAREFPPHLATIVPVASPYIGVDFPMRNNVMYPYVMQWLTLVAGRTAQDKVFWNNASFWASRFRQWFESGQPFRELDAFMGNPSPIFQEWIEHPRLDAYWDSYNPTAEQYAKLSLPILTITGIYDGDQPGALMHYREHLKHASPEAGTRHYLVIGPWDHAGTRVPKAEFAGVKAGPASLVDLQRLHFEWYEWTMQRGPKPKFLKKPVTYYVMGAEKWRYADTLDAVTARFEPLYLHSKHNPSDAFHSGSLLNEPMSSCEPDHYVYDPRDVRHAEIESRVDPYNLADQTVVHALAGKQLVYHGVPFEQDIEISGFFRLRAWFSIDQPDTDIQASVYEIALDGSSLLLSDDCIRARYREGLREEKLIQTQDPLRYDFESFMFLSRRIKKGCRLRLVIGPINSIYRQKNYNSGGSISDESMKQARQVTVKLLHDRAYPSALYVPIGQIDSGADS
jgi:putative CocE/NonD family hydrolase